MKYKKPIFAVALLLCCIVCGLACCSDDAAADQGSAANPLPNITGIYIDDMAVMPGDWYVANGGTIDVPKYTENGLSIYAYSVTAGHGISISNGGLTGTASTNGYVDIVIDAQDFGEGTTTKRIYIVDAPLTTYTITLTTSGESSGHWEYIDNTVSSVTVSAGTTYYAYGTYGIYLSDGRVLTAHADYAAYKVSYVNPAPVTDTQITSNITVDAYIIAKPTYTATLQYNKNGGSGTAPTSQTSTTYGYPITFTAKSGSSLSYTNFTFIGWTLDQQYAAGTVPSSGIYYYNDTVKLYSSGTHTMYAVWESTQVVYTYNLSFDANGGIGGPGSMPPATSTETEYYFQIPATVPTRDGYVFLGWSFDDSAVVAEYDPNDYVRVTAQSNTLYAVWSDSGEPIYTYGVKFNGNGGSGIPTNLTGTGSAISYTFTIPDVVPIRNGYTFVGWATESTATSASVSPGSTMAVAANTTTTLFAVWSENSSVSLSFENVIKTIGQTFFGGSTSLAGLAMIIVAWLVMIAILANLGASPTYSALPMIPIILMFSAFGIISTEITFFVIIVCAVMSASSLRDIITR